MPDTDIAGKMRWSIEQRLAFIEFRLYWDGHINRSDLVKEFGISTPQASADLSRYQTLAQGNLQYDSSAKTYIAGPQFEPVLFVPSARQYLAHLRSLADGAFTKEQTWLGSVPAFDVIPLVRRRLDPSRLRKVLRAIREGAALRVKYQSFSSPEPRMRWITPHALGFDGFRWHARAWCHEHQDFRDFVLARVLSVGESKPDKIEPKDDLGWQSEVTLRIGPHPELSEGMRRTIELDFGMKAGVVEVTARACLSYYLVQHLNLDRDPNSVPASRQQIVLLNREEILAAQDRFRVPKDSRLAG